MAGVHTVDISWDRRPGGMGLDPKHFLYFHLDNEPECWSSTHDDVCPKPMTPEQCVQKYVAVAKELRTRYPQVKILAPGFTAEASTWYTRLPLSGKTTTPVGCGIRSVGSSWKFRK